MTTNRRRTPARLAVAALATALLAAACGGGGDEKQTADTGPECPVGALADASGPVEITVWHTYTALGKRTLEAIAESYNASQKKVVVKIESQGVGPRELSRKVDQAAPDRSLPAIIVPDDTKTRWVADSGLFIPAEACFDADPSAAAIRKDFLPIAPASYTIDGRLWPASFSTYTALIYLNRAHFRAAGLDPDSPPRTIDEMLDAARAIKAANIEGVDRPMVFKAMPFMLEWWLSGAREELVNEENGRSGELATRSRFDNPTTRSILEKLRAAKDEGILDVTPGAEGNVDHLLAMATRQSSFTVESSAAASTVAGVIEGTIRAEDLQEEFGVPMPAGVKLDLDLGVGPYPGVKEAGKGQVGGMAWYMTNTVPKEQQAAAWDFLKYLNGGEAQARWAIEGSIAPIGRAAAENPDVQQAWTGSLAGRWEKEAYDVLANIETDFPGPVIGPYDEVRAAIEKCLDQVLLNDEPIDGAVSDADATITSALKRYRSDVGAG